MLSRLRCIFKLGQQGQQKAEQEENWHCHSNHAMVLEVEPQLHSKIIQKSFTNHWNHAKSHPTSELFWDFMGFPFPQSIFDKSATRQLLVSANRISRQGISCLAWGRTRRDKKLWGFVASVTASWVANEMLPITAILGNFMKFVTCLCSLNLKLRNCIMLLLQKVWNSNRMPGSHQKSNELAKRSIDLCWESLLDKATRSAVCQRGKSFARLFGSMHNCDLRCFKDFAVRLVRTALKSSSACLPIAENV